MQNIRSLLIENASPYEMNVSPEQADRFQQYAERLVEWNEKINLTAITEPREIVVKHFLDSILILKDLNPAEGASLIDVGTGAGFPGVALKIMRPDLKITLLDSLNKRLVFLADLLDKLGLEAELVHARAEEAGRTKEHRLRYDFATARAVARLNVLCEFCLPFLRQGGIFAAMKGPGGEEELKTAKRAVQVLGCRVQGCRSYELPGGDARTLILVKRTGLLAAEYPRQGGKIAKESII